MYTDNAVGNVVAETGRNGGTTTRLSDRSMPFPLCASPLTGEVQRSPPEPSARPSAAADSEERQICTTCFFMESVGLCLCFLPSSAMYKDKAVGNVVAEMGRDLVFIAPKAVGQGAPQAINCPLGRMHRPRGSTGD